MKNGTKIAIVVAICFCVIVMSLGGYFAYTSMSSEDDSEPADVADDTASAGTTTPSASAGTTTPSASAGTTTPSASAGTTTPSASAGTTTPSASAGTTTPSTSAGTTTPSTSAGTTTPSTPVVNTSSGDLTPVTTPVSSGLLDDDDDDSGDFATVPTSTAPVADPLTVAFEEGGTGKFNKHLPGYCLNWKKGDQNRGDINYRKKTVAECKKLCFDKGPDGSDELTACEWGKGDINSSTDRADCIGHTADINRYRASGHNDRICWTTAAPANHDDEELYGKR